MGEYDLLGGPSILLVEDHPFQLIGLELQLNRMGFFRLTPALNCHEALAIIREGRRFDLLLCDQYLPDGKGVDLIKDAYELNSIRHAILLSGIDDRLTLERLLLTAQLRGLPLLASLSKPLSSQEYLKAVDRLYEARTC